MKTPRLFYLLVLNILLALAIVAIAPQQVAVTLYKLSLVTTAGLIGYWLDRALFPYARPDEFIKFRSNKFNQEFPFAETVVNKDLALVFAAAMLRRAIIVGCAMLAMGLGA